MYVAVTVRAGATPVLTVPDSAVRRKGKNQFLVSVAVVPNQLAQRWTRLSVGIRKCFRDSRRANTWDATWPAPLPKPKEPYAGRCPASRVLDDLARRIQ